LPLATGDTMPRWSSRAAERLGPDFALLFCLRKNAPL